MTDVLRIGLAGPGRWGTNYLRTVSGIDGLSVSCVYRRFAAPVEGFAGVPVTLDFDELIASCDVVVVSTPPDLHEPLVVRALAAGRPVMVEKPAALDLPSVVRMFAAAEEHRQPLLVDHVHLFSPAFCVMREWTRGWRVRRVSSLSGSDGPFRNYSALYDWGPHDLSMCLSLFMSDPSDMEASRVASGRGEMFDVFLGFGEAYANLRFGNGLGAKTKVMTVSSPDGEAVYDGSAQTLEFRGKTISFSATTPLREALLVFRKLARGEQDWRADPWVSIETARLLDDAKSLTSTRSDRSLLRR